MRHSGAPADAVARRAVEGARSGLGRANAPDGAAGSPCATALLVVVIRELDSNQFPVFERAERSGSNRPFSKSTACWAH